MEPYVDVLITSPEEVIWEGKAKSVSSINLEGPFDILLFHANFVTIVENQPIKIITSDGSSLTYKFKTSVIYNRKNTVSVYTNL